MDVPAPRRSLPEVFLRGLWVAAGRRQGVRYDDPARFEPLRAARTGVRLDPDRIARYAGVCGWPLIPGEVPLPYPEILFLDLLGALATSPRFPISPLGMIHIAQTIALHRPLVAGTTVDIACRTAAVRDTPRGVELDCALEVAAAEGIAWEGVATFLSRTSGSRGAPRSKDRVAHAAPTSASERFLDVPADTGRRYAQVSDDWNPHHLWPLTARPLGYARPIAHGMWTLAATLATLGPACGPCGPLRVAARFLRPLLMPARVRIGSRTLDGGGLGFEVRDAASGTPHLAGSLALAPVA